MHHADLDFDVTTAIRFHPVEIIFSLVIKMLVILVIGASIFAVLLFEVLLNATSLFNHANIRIPKNVDKLLRIFIVTPDMHRVHHSIIRKETDSNFGFNLPWWDYIFKTYRAKPMAGHIDMTIGIDYFRKQRELWLDRLLSQPFRKAD
jgi:sterol desaturase/sphingolipid hydroxylase (fatty acid hydroxylase superfamily)